MSKKRFVEFYLSAMMRAAAANQIIRLAYTFIPSTTLGDLEVVTITYGIGTKLSVLPIDVTGMDLLEIAAAVIEVRERERERERTAGATLH